MFLYGVRSFSNDCVSLLDRSLIGKHTLDLVIYIIQLLHPAIDGSSIIVSLCKGDTVSYIGLPDGWNICIDILAESNLRNFGIGWLVCLVS